MKKIKLPSATVMIFGSLIAFWIADIINPSFSLIGIGILLFIPVFIIEFLYPHAGQVKLFEQINPVSPAEESSES